MASGNTALRKPSRFAAAFRVLLITFLCTLFSFAVGLLVGIITMAIVNAVKGGGIDMAYAYRMIALPFALAVMLTAFLVATVHEVRSYRRARRQMMRAA